MVKYVTELSDAVAPLSNKIAILPPTQHCGDVMRPADSSTLRGRMEALWTQEIFLVSVPTHPVIFDHLPEIFEVKTLIEDCSFGLQSGGVPYAGGSQQTLA